MYGSDWTDIGYLSKGNSIQREVYRLINQHRLLDRLKEYNPILVGTVPIDIHVAGSDLDIICEVHDFERFDEALAREFGKYPGYTAVKRSVDGIERMKANFMCDHWPVEVFGQAVPTVKQNGFRHMVIEARLLQLFGESFKRKIIEMKSYGIKTEPAFARELQLEGDPYEELLKLCTYSDEELKELWAG
ncbi:DUF4269 domain-containing protein [Paenibacillus hamazuiensis]|uniref:DUF4269 domain-containing protein n=1 Tax=Paenibacillus hamazuiensis TaxID=2936508 RepID=UPI00200CA3D9|nr:DUF4269 domain-containing protein [Paenibacillus hamazuiensis]